MTTTKTRGDRHALRTTVETEIAKRQVALKTLTREEVAAVHAAEIARYGAGEDAMKGTRTELSAALQLRNPPPHAPDESVMRGVLSIEAREELHESKREEISDAHRVLSDRARALDPHHLDAHHFVQKLHGTAIWREVDRLMKTFIVGASS